MVDVCAAMVNVVPQLHRPDKSAAGSGLLRRGCSAGGERCQGGEAALFSHASSALGSRGRSKRPNEQRACSPRCAGPGLCVAAPAFSCQQGRVARARPCQHTHRPARWYRRAASSPAARQSAWPVQPHRRSCRQLPGFRPQPSNGIAPSLRHAFMDEDDRTGVYEAGACCKGPAVVAVCGTGEHHLAGTGLEIRTRGAAGAVGQVEAAGKSTRQFVDIYRASGPLAGVCQRQLKDCIGTSQCLKARSPFVVIPVVPAVAHLAPLGLIDQPAY